MLHNSCSRAQPNLEGTVTQQQEAMKHVNKCGSPKLACFTVCPCDFPLRKTLAGLNDRTCSGESAKLTTWPRPRVGQGD